MENVMGIEFKEGAVCFANEKQWFACNLPSLGDIVSEEDTYLDFAKAVTPFDNDFQLNTIKRGDYIKASELDTERKYNDVVEVFGLFGFERDVDIRINSTIKFFECLKALRSRLIATDCVGGRKLTYPQIMAIGELKRLEIERDKSAPKTAPDLTPDLVQKPSHYQFFEGVEVIEIIASSMTREQFKGYCLGNRIKYRLRAGNKDELEQEIAKSDKYVELYDEHKHLCKK